jgi:hypothetical protein
MPATSIDTFFACSLLVVLVVSAMAAMPKVMSPFLDGLAHRNDVERLQQLAQYIVLSTGAPTDWGSNLDVSPTDFGLASSSASGPYALDVDKVTRLNSRNAYSITYADLLDDLKVGNIALKIIVQPIFNTSIDLISKAYYRNDTSYSFEITTQNSGLAVPSDTSCYLIINGFVNSLTSFTNSSGKGVASFIVPSSVSGSGLLIVFARAQSNPSIVSFCVFLLENDSSSLEPDDTFAKLNPLDDRLNASFNYHHEQTLGVYAFSYSYWANLTMLSNMTQTAEYSFPRFLDPSITVLVLTGLNGTKSFAQWIAYPQIPLDVGVNFDSPTSGGSVESFTYFVTLGSATYELQIECREVG